MRRGVEALVNSALVDQYLDLEINQGQIRKVYGQALQIMKQEITKVLNIWDDEYRASMNKKNFLKQLPKTIKNYQQNFKDSQASQILSKKLNVRYYYDNNYQFDRIFNFNWRITTFYQPSGYLRSQSPGSYYYVSYPSFFQFKNLTRRDNKINFNQRFFSATLKSIKQNFLSFLGYIRNQHAQKTKANSLLFDGSEIKSGNINAWVLKNVYNTTISDHPHPKILDFTQLFQFTELKKYDVKTGKYKGLQIKISNKYLKRQIQQNPFTMGGIVSNETQAYRIAHLQQNKLKYNALVKSFIAFGKLDQEQSKFIFQNPIRRKKLGTIYRMVQNNLTGIYQQDIQKDLQPDYQAKNFIINTQGEDYQGNLPIHFRDIVDEMVKTFSKIAPFIGSPLGTEIGNDIIRGTRDKRFQKIIALLTQITFAKLLQYYRFRQKIQNILSQAGKDTQFTNFYANQNMQISFYFLLYTQILKKEQYTQLRIPFSYFFEIPLIDIQTVKNRDIFIKNIQKQIGDLFQTKYQQYIQFWNFQNIRDLKVQIQNLKMTIQNYQEFPQMNIPQLKNFNQYYLKTTSLQQNLLDKIKSLVTKQKIWTVYTTFKQQYDLYGQYIDANYGYFCQNLRLECPDIFQNLDCLGMITFYLFLQRDGYFNDEQNIGQLQNLWFSFFNQDGINHHYYQLAQKGLAQQISHQFQIDFFVFPLQLSTYDRQKTYKLRQQFILLTCGHAFLCNDKDFKQKILQERQIAFKTSFQLAQPPGKAKKRIQLLQRTKNQLLKIQKMNYDQFGNQYLRKGCAYLDIQTYAKLQQVMPIYLAVLVVYDFKGQKYIFKKDINNYRQQFKGYYPNSIMDSIAWIISNFANQCYWLKLRKGKQINLSYKNFTVWTFNGLRFDYIYLIKQLLNYVGKMKTLGQGRQSKGYSCKLLTLQDGTNFSGGGSLAQATQKLQVKKQKYDIKLITTQKQYLDDQQNIKKYCLKDCQSLQCFIQNFYKSLWQAYLHMYKTKLQQRNNLVYCVDRIDISKILSQPTVSSISLYIAKSIFLQKSYQSNQSPQQINQQRQNFSGGMVQVIRHFIPKGKKVFQVDANSMYPSLMKYLPMIKTLNSGSFQTQFHFQQYFKSKIKKAKKKLLKFYNNEQLQILRQRLDFEWDQDADQPKNGQFQKLLTTRFRISFYTFRDNQLPFIKSTTQAGIFYKKSGMGTSLYGINLLQMFINGSKFQVTNFQQYTQYQVSNNGQDNPFWSYVKLCYDYKAKAKKYGNFSLQKIYKLMLNSIYGKFLQKKFNFFTLWDQNQWYSKQRWYQKVKQQQNFVMTQIQNQQQLTIGNFVRLAQMITQRARCTLAKTVRRLGIQHVYYMDTDSLYVDSQVINIFYDFNLIGQNLGQWKIQNPKAPYTRGWFVARKNVFLYAQYYEDKQLYFNLQDLNHRELNLFKRNILKLDSNHNQEDYKKALLKIQWKIRLKGVKADFDDEYLRWILSKLDYYWIQIFRIGNQNKDILFFKDAFCLQFKTNIQFEVQLWRKVFKTNEKIKIMGVYINQIVKDYSIHFKRIPNQDGTTRALRGHVFLQTIN